MARAHTSMNSSIWFITMREHPDELTMHRELIAELEALYRKARVFPNEKFTAIYFAIGYLVDVPERVKLGRVRKADNNTLWVELIVDGHKWDNLSTAELKDHLLLMMVRAVAMAGKRYKFQTAPFEEKIREIEQKLGSRA
jgi:hypothetical protein